MKIKVLEQEFVICKIESFEEVSIHDEFCFISKTNDEISLVCTSRYIPNKVTNIQKGYRAFRFEEELNFNAIGTIAKVTSLLSLNEIQLLVISTFNTDYFLIKNTKLNKALDILSANNYSVVE